MSLLPDCEILGQCKSNFNDLRGRFEGKFTAKVASLAVKDQESFQTAWREIVSKQYVDVREWYFGKSEQVGTMTETVFQDWVATLLLNYKYMTNSFVDFWTIVHILAHQDDDQIIYLGSLHSIRIHEILIKYFGYTLLQKIGHSNVSACLRIPDKM
jgi:hypothetical protein